MRMFLRIAFVIALIATPIPRLLAADAAPVAETAERFVRQQTQAQPGKVTITVGAVDVGRLPPCTSHEGFLPPGSRLSGKAHIGVRCLGPGNWSVLVPVQISIAGNYVTTGRPLPAGHVLTEGDLVVVAGDLAALPNGVVSEPQAAVGKSLRNALGAGQVLRSDQLLAPLVIRQGQTVRVVSQGTGFAVSAEGKAISNAAIGQIVQVRMPSGQTVSGMARADGSVDVSF